MMKRNDYTIPGKHTGFTLIEVLIAIAIFAILSMLAYGGLNAVIESREQTEASLQRLKQLQLTISHLHRDIEQIAARDATDELGGNLLKLSAGHDSDLLLQFTRSGWRNPAGLTRSHLQRVAYRIEENKLIRLSWPYVDRAQDTQAIETQMIDNIKEVKLRFYNDGQWHDNWLTFEALNNDTQQTLPQAIEVTLHMEDWGEIVRLFRVPG